MKNCLCVFSLRLGMSIRNMFVDIFMALYLWGLSGGSVGVLCTYYTVFTICIYSSMLIAGSICSKRKHRKYLLLLGCILQTSFLIAMYFLEESCITYLVPLAALNGTSDGMYYCIYNLYECEGVSNESRVRVLGIYNIVDGFAKVLFPVASGFLIQAYGMKTCTFIAVIVALFCCIVSFIYQDNGDSIGAKFSFRNMLTALLGEKDGRKKLCASILCNLFRGFINSFGSFSLFITVFTMVMFPTAVGVGTVSGVSMAVKILFSFLFAKLGGRAFKKSMKVYIVMRVLLIISLVFMAANGDVVFLFAVTFFSKCSDAVESMVYSAGACTLSNSGAVSAYKSEFYIFKETALTIARLTGYGLLWLYGSNNGVLAVCILFYSIILVAGPLAQGWLYKLAYDE